MKEQKLKITRKTVRALIKRELGISVTDLDAKELPDGTYYEDILIGKGFTLEIYPYTFKPKRYYNQGEERIVIHLRLASNFVAQSINLFFDPVSLERDYTVEGEYLHEIDLEKCDGCVSRVHI